MYTDTPAIADTRRPHSGKLSQEALLHQSDDRLVALARSGSERAWDGDHAPLRAPAARPTARASSVPSRAEDAVQQTFLQAFLALRDGSRARDRAARMALPDRAQLRDRRAAQERSRTTSSSISSTTASRSRPRCSSSARRCGGSSRGCATCPTPSARRSRCASSKAAATRRSPRSWATPVRASAN